MTFGGITSWDNLLWNQLLGDNILCDNFLWENLLWDNLLWDPAEKWEDEDLSRLSDAPDYGTVSWPDELYDYGLKLSPIPFWVVSAAVVFRLLVTI